MPRRGERLAEGSFSHPLCPECDDGPAVKVQVDTDKQWATRLRFCDTEGGALVNFSIALQYDSPTGWRDIARWSVAHANYHLYQYNWDSRRRATRSFGLVNEVGDVARAYQHAVGYAYPQTQKWLDRWREGLRR